MTDSDNLVERLRSYARWDNKFGNEPDSDHICWMAADRIESLEREVEELRKGWQPIETAPDDDPVLVFVAAIGEVVRAYKDADSSKWVGHCGEAWLDGRVTHWMPLPEPPAKEQHHEQD